MKTKKKFVNTTPYKILAELVTRAIYGKLVTSRREFPKKQLDCSSGKGKAISRFLRRQDFVFPAPSLPDQVKRIQMIITMLIWNDVDVNEEIKSILLLTRKTKEIRVELATLTQLIRQAKEDMGKIELNAQIITLQAEIERLRNEIETLKQLQQPAIEDKPQ